MMFTKNWKSTAVLRLLSVMGLASGLGCQDEKFLYLSQQTDRTVSQTAMIREVHGSSGVDILWVIDNSGSMATPQKSVVDNAEKFMEEFSKASVDWKLGLISTDDSEKPFLGFNSSFDRSSADPVGVFGRAVDSLGTNGSASERAFDPIINSLKNFPTFLRPKKALAVIIVTDVEDQSRLTAPQFLASFKSIIGDRPYYTYGIFGAPDFNCQAMDDRWQYAGSRYEEFMNSSSSHQVYPLCSADYGVALANIGRDISTVIARPQIDLTDRPETSTIRVDYKGRLLPGGPQEDGGYWYYDYGLNAIVFYSLEFSTDETDSVSITYEKTGGLVPAASAS
ncbi:MAG: VWA domain-containing protein [Proteobacteria bacterium]|nr:MAG: VWA domain-containing protein [Pseudomonadota bacterium]